MTYNITYTLLIITVITMMSGPYSSAVRARAQEAEALGSILTTSN